MAHKLSWSQVLEAEFTALHGTAPLGVPAPVSPVSTDAPANEDERLRTIHQAIHQKSTSGLCLSGGGIRSGTFALGVMQGLAHVGVLGAFDYLSTVSGGGYTGGWFTAWLHRQGPAGRERTLRLMDPSFATTDTGNIDAPAVEYLRRTCRYLAPRGGFASADFWTVLATLARNLILNWFVVLPLVAAALLVPRLFYTLTVRFETGLDDSLQGLACFRGSRAPAFFLTLALGGFAVAIGYVAAVFSGIGSRWSQGRFLAWFVVPLSVAAVGCSLFWSSFVCRLYAPWMLGIAAALPATGWALLGVLGRVFRPAGETGPQSRIGVRTILAAAVSGLILGGGSYAIATFGFGFGIEPDEVYLYGVVSVPIVLGLVLLTITVFVGLASQDMDDAALEWWSRCAAWVGMATAGWLVVSVLALYLADGLEAGIGLAVSALHVEGRSATGVIAALLPLLGSLAGMAVRSTGATDKPSPARLAFQRFALPIIIVTLLTSVAWGNLRAVEAIEYHRDSVHQICTPESTKGDGDCHPKGGGYKEVVGLGAVYLAFGLLMSVFVPANRFSLHGMYRQRLVRTFLGASRDDREPNPFTGFDGQDDLLVHQLAGVRPLHVMNATLNAVSSTTVGRHETQAQSFTFSPLHVGNREVGYRPAEEYGSDDGQPGTGLSLGMAIAVSGAAASSSMGIYSSKSRAFLLTLANARLGLWFGNPGNEKSWQNSEPPLGVGPILRELLGLTTDRNPYVYLSDGGHYENLGLWEMVQRRCRYIVVSDAGCDPEYGFDDLSNAVRRIRLDLGVPIHFSPLPMTKAGQGESNSHVAIGTVRYSVIDGADAPDGTIVYIKATLSGDEPVDVWNFARTNQAFPHDPTSDQFFDEARFESYRNLGFHSVLAAVAGWKPDHSEFGVEGLCRAAERTFNTRADKAQPIET